MKTIWKYPLQITDRQILMVPGKSEFLSVIEQNDTPTLYAGVDPELPIDPIEVLIYGTGHPVDEAILLSHGFLGTVKTHGGQLVWHVFVQRKK